MATDIGVKIGIALHFMIISHEMHFSATSSCPMTLRNHTYSVARGAWLGSHILVDQWITCVSHDVQWRTLKKVNLWSTVHSLIYGLPFCVASPPKRLIRFLFIWYQSINWGSHVYDKFIFILTLNIPWPRLKVVKYFDFVAWRYFLSGTTLLSFSSKMAQPMSLYQVPVIKGNNIDVQHTLWFYLPWPMIKFIKYFWICAGLLLYIGFTSITTHPMLTTPVMMAIYRRLRATDLI